MINNNESTNEATNVATNEASNVATNEATNEDSYINKITLEYLLNPSIHIKTNSSNDLLNKDIKFYKKRICQITKDMSSGEFININLQSIFNNYVSQLIYYFKQIDYDEINQEEYNDLNKEQNDNNQELEHISSLNNILKKTLPIIKDININDPILRNKGIKKN